MQQEGVQAYIIPSVDQHMVHDYKTCYQAMSLLIIDISHRVMKRWQNFFKISDIISIAEK